MLSKQIGLTLSFFIFSAFMVNAQSTKSVWLDDLAIDKFSEGIRPVKAKTNYLIKTIGIGSMSYQRGVSGITPCVFSIYLKGNAHRFTAEVGVDDSANKEIPLKFYVVGDNKILFESGEMRVGDPARKVDIMLDGVQRLGLLVKDDVGGLTNKRTYCNWADAKFEMLADTYPEQIPNSDERYLLTPKPGQKPRINSAKVFGATPGNPFLYTIATTGKRPMQFSVENLPDGLILDPKTGIITGKVIKRGVYHTILKAKNVLGEATKSLTIKIGDTIALTPPIGWNGWNALAGHLNKENVMASARGMVKSGLRDHGWSYINIDDSWQGMRGGPLNALQPNEKFSNIKEMVDEIHSLGLKAGIYSSPYVYSYGGYPSASSDFEKGGENYQPLKANRKSSALIGKYRFEKNDALQMAEWGFDFLKYDWRIDVNSAERMSTALKQSGRDFVFSLSNNAPFEKAKEWARVSNMWRTGPDIRDNWNNLYMLSFTLDKWAPFSGPGHWNDPDMMIVGDMATGAQLHPTRLTPDEQYSHISMYSLLAAPMLIGCPLDQLDAFTLNLLSNDEVIEINQDPLGKQGRLIADENGVQIWLKPMEDGSYAVGLFNTDNFGKTPESYFRWGNEKPKTFDLDISSIGLQGKWRFRNVWKQKDEGVFSKKYTTSIRFHGVVLLRLYPVK